MSITPTEEQEELRALVRGFLDDRSPIGATQELVDLDGRGHSADLWRQMADQLGLQAIGAPEELGGVDAGLAELVVVIEELGRVLMVTPYLSTVGFAAQTLLLSGDRDACQRWLPAIAAGELTATLALTESTGEPTAEGMTTVAKPVDEGWEVSGIKDFVPDGDIASLLVLPARIDGEVGWFVLEARAAGLTRQRHDSLDLTRPLARIELDHAPATRLAVDDGAALYAQALTTVHLLVAAEQVGGAARCLEMAVEYAKLREQFGRQIGSFQAIKHRCADLLVEVEAARSALAYATQSLVDGEDDRAVAVLVARAQASEAYILAAKQNIQLHGGIGFTWEHPAHLFLRRAKSSELLYGGPGWVRRRIGELVDLDGATR